MKWISLVVPFLAVVLIHTSLAFAAGSTPPPKLGSITYIGYEGAPLNLTEQVAIEKGMFAARGLDVTFVGVASGQQFASALMGGSAQIGVLTTPAAVPLIRQGQCFEFLTSGARTYYNIIAQPGLKLSHAHDPFPLNLLDLKGKTIGINARGTALESMTDAVLQQAGINPADVTFIATGGAATSVAAFRNHQVDVLVDFPIAEQLLQPNEYQSIARLSDIEKYNPIYKLTQVFSGTTCSYAKANPAVITAFCSAVGEAYRFVNDTANRSAVLDVVQKTLNINRSMAESFWQQYKASWPSPKIDAASWSAQKILLPSGTNLPSYSQYVSAACQAKL